MTEHGDAIDHMSDDEVDALIPDADADPDALAEELIDEKKRVAAKRHKAKAVKNSVSRALAAKLEKEPPAAPAPSPADEERAQQRLRIAEVLGIDPGRASDGRLFITLIRQRKGACATSPDWYTGELDRWAFTDFEEEFTDMNDFWDFVQSRYQGGNYQIKVLDAQNRIVTGSNKILAGTPKMPDGRSEAEIPSPAAPPAGDPRRPAWLDEIARAAAPVPAPPSVPALSDPLDVADAIQRAVSAQGAERDLLYRDMLTREREISDKLAVARPGEVNDSAEMIRNIMKAHQARKLIEIMEGPKAPPPPPAKSFTEQMTEFINSPIGLMLGGGIKKLWEKGEDLIEGIMERQSEAADWKSTLAVEVGKGMGEVARAVVKLRGGHDDQQEAASPWPPRAAYQLPAPPRVPAVESEVERRSRAARAAMVHRHRQRTLAEAEPMPPPSPSMTDLLSHMMAQATTMAPEPFAASAVDWAGKNMSPAQRQRLDQFTADLNPRTVNLIAQSLSIGSDLRGHLAGFMAQWRATAAGAPLDAAALSAAISELTTVSEAG